MTLPAKLIQIISAPSVLGLQSNGVELLAEKFLENGLAKKINSTRPIVSVPTLNNQRSNQRDPVTKCLNPVMIHEFSLTLKKVIADTNHFALVLGGDCSILLGIMPALKSKGNYGLIFIDAHADFYEPEKSTTGEVADMDLAIVTGRGPEILTNIDGLKPYVRDEHVIHIAQRDWEETKKFGSQDIRETNIKCFSLEAIKKAGAKKTTDEILDHIATLKTDGYWIHFDTDVLNDAINPAVDYRIPGGLQFEEVEYFVNNFLQKVNIVGMSVTIYNALLDKTGSIAANITDCLGRMFQPKPYME
jgi:arginase